MLLISGIAALVDAAPYVGSFASFALYAHVSTASIWPHALFVVIVTFIIQILIGFALMALLA